MSGARRSMPPGFTLIELVLVLVILGLSLSLVAPSISAGLSGVQAKTAARSIAGLFKEGRSVALATGEATYLELEAHAARLKAGRGGKTIKEVRLPDGLTLTAEAGVVVFYPSGGSSGGSLKLNGRNGGRLYSIEAETSTGEARVDAK